MNVSAPERYCNMISDSRSRDYQVSFYFLSFLGKQVKGSPVRLIKLGKSGSCSGQDKNLCLRIIVLKANTRPNSLARGGRAGMLPAYKNIFFTINLEFHLHRNAYWNIFVPHPASLSCLKMQC